jgi:hypothetical protein
MTFKLLGRNKNDLENKIKIVKAISKVINMNFLLQKCARICLKAKVWSKAKNIQEANLRRTLKKWTQDMSEAYKYLDTEDNYDTEHMRKKRRNNT